MKTVVALGMLTTMDETYDHDDGPGGVGGDDDERFLVTRIFMRLTMVWRDLLRGCTFQLQERQISQIGNAGKDCPESCRNGCPSCNGDCIGCDFCDPNRSGPFGKAAEYCKADLEASDQDGTLLWSPPPSKGLQTVAGMPMDVNCRAPCYEVWFSSVPSFSGFQTQIVRGNNSLVLPEVSTAAYARVRALQFSEVTGEVGRSAWSNPISWGAGGAEVAVPTTVKTSTFTTRTFTSITLTTTVSTLPPDAPTTMQPLWALPASRLPGGASGSAPDGVEATLGFAVAPAAVEKLGTAKGQQDLQASIAAMLQVDRIKVSLLEVRAAYAVIGGPKAGRRLRGAPKTGGLQADFVVLCADAAERHAMTEAIEASVRSGAGERFAQQLEALSGTAVRADDVHCAMVNREWSRSMAQLPSEGRDSLTVVSKPRDAQGRGRSLFGIHHLSLIAVALALCVSCLTFATCASQRGNASQKETEPFLSGGTWDSDSSPEPEKGFAPAGTRGFDPKRFDRQKYFQRAGMASSQSYQSQRFG
ncbi:unnamed protein product [Symbiodinium sp. CCMP2592]|nr:unnamed protein product [Symbiodinium sp. CCMP2592]